jgi:hypothetical protein
VQGTVQEERLNRSGLLEKCEEKGVPTREMLIDRPRKKL